jgi:hypothetical protein
MCQFSLWAGQGMSEAQSLSRWRNKEQTLWPCCVAAGIIRRHRNSLMRELTLLKMLNGFR